MASLKQSVLHALAQLAPLSLAESWDNVGLLVDPGGVSSFTRAFLTIDLTLATLEEALEGGADLIIAYHPPIFSGLRRLRADDPSEGVVVRALGRGMTIYSPHTALDAASGGMTDWLCAGIGPGKVRPIVPSAISPEEGSGRILSLHTPVSLEEVLARVKVHLGLSHVRLSRAEVSTLVTTVAVCPGAGGSLFEKAPDVDLLLTGEMRHHDVLGRKARGTHVILTDHTNTERGYLPIFAERLEQACPGLPVLVSRVDADPLVVV